MEAKEARLVQSIQAYLEDPPRDTPEQLLDNLGAVAEMFEAPRYSEETPGEKSAREVAEEMASRLGAESDTTEADNQEVSSSA